MKINLVPLLVGLFLLTGCSGQASEGGNMESNTYTQISAEEAKSMMDGQKAYILLDVRTEEEYAEGHIEGSVLIPDTEIADRAEGELPDKETAILVYCRSGRRSKQAAQTLANLGYTNVYDLGGILDWPYDVIK